MNRIVYALAFCVMTSMSASCDRVSQPDSPIVEAGPPPATSPSMLSDISGVWRASDGTMVSIVYDENKLRLLFGEDSISVQVGSTDELNHTVNLKVTRKNGKPAIWTVAQVFDPSNKEAFTLQLTLDDGTQDQLSFVRKISTDDLNVIAAAESKAHLGSISAALDDSQVQGAADTAEMAADVAADVAAASNPFDQSQPSVGPSTWAPSFDCAKAATGPERLICSSGELSAADVNLAQAYRAARDASTDKGSLANQQATWRKTVRDACADVQCMLGAYEQRQAELR